MRRRNEDPLFARERKPHFHGLVVVILFLAILIALGFLFNAINNRRVTVIRQPVTVPALSSSLEGFKILHISDLHGARFGDHQDEIMASLNGLSYQAVCITGDSCGPDGDFTALMELLEGLPENIPVFLIAGDEDPAPILSAAHGINTVKAEYIMAAEKRGAIYLDAPQKIQAGKSTLWFCPDNYYTLDISSTRRSLASYREELLSRPETSDTAAALRANAYYLDLMDRMEQAKREMLSSDFGIAVTHVPLSADTIRTVRDGGGLPQSLSLVLSGHYVNGQMRIPGIGAVWVPASYGLDKQWLVKQKLSGVVQVQGIPQYISPGLGSSGLYPLSSRVCNSPAVTLITLTAKLTQ